MDWQQKTLRKLREAHRCNNELRYRISDVKILLYEFEEYDAEHALMVDTMNTLNRLRKVLFELERKLITQMQNTCLKCGQWFSAHNDDGSCVVDDHTEGE